MNADRKYLVVCEQEPPRSTSYQCSEPEEGPSKNEFSGGFDVRLSKAIPYLDYEAARKVRNRMAKIYFTYEIRIISMCNKDLFLARLEG